MTASVKPKRSRNKPSQFEEGVLMAAAALMRSADEPVYAADILKEFALDDANCAGFDDMDKDELRRIRDSEGLRLRGLD
jgi:hypothetical protein